MTLHRHAPDHEATETQSRRERLARGARALVAPILMAALTIGIYVKKEHDNQAALDQERARISAALNAELNDLTQRLSLVAGRNSLAIAGPTEREAVRNWSNGGFDRLFLVDYETGAAETGGPLVDAPSAYAPYAPKLSEAIAQSRAALGESLRGFLGEDGERGPSRVSNAQAVKSLYIIDHGAPVAAVIIPFATPRQVAGGDAKFHKALIALRGFDGGVMGRLMQRSGLAVTLQRPETDNGHAHLAVAESEEALTWIPTRPGDLFANRTLVVLAILIALYSAFAALRANRELNELAQKEREAKHSAGRDLLSGLPNRMMFSKLVDAEASRSARAGGGFAIFYLDLDRFKEINDTYGHGGGDRLIVAMAERVNEVLREQDRMARLGGDEFAILQTEVRGPHDCEMLAGRILKAMARPFDLGDGEVIVGVSIGIALWPHNSRDTYELMHLADLALYRAKNEGRNRYCFFEARMGEELRLRRSIEESLRAAIAENHLTLHYQPIVCPQTDRVISIEGLVRWPHPQKGLLRPEDFLGVADDRGLALPLGDWVLRRACADVAPIPGLRVSINISPIYFRHGDFLENVRRILDETGLEPGRLELEITEAVVLNDPAAAESTIMDLRAMGVRMTLDDFGSGHASLLYLRRFAFDKIKLDRSLVQTMESTGESAMIVRTTLELAEGLGLAVTAKGVETEEQQMLLKTFGCKEIQGFQQAPALPLEALCDLLAAREAAAARDAAVIPFIAGGTQRRDI